MHCMSCMHEYVSLCGVPMHFSSKMPTGLSFSEICPSLCGVTMNACLWVHACWYKKIPHSIIPILFFLVALSDSDSCPHAHHSDSDTILMTVISMF